MLVGEPPFTGPTAQAIVAKVMTDGAAPASRPSAGAVPTHVETAVLTALAKLPADRFATAAEFAAALVAPMSTAGRTITIGTRPPAREKFGWLPAAMVGAAPLASAFWSRAWSGGARRPSFRRWS